MRAKLINDNFQIPLSNRERNTPIFGSYPLSKIQYENSDKNKEPEEKALEEKFSEETDPISDRGIGDIDFSKIYDDIKKESALK